MQSAAPAIRLAAPGEGEVIGTLTERIYREGGFTDDAYAAVLRDGVTRVRHATVFVAHVGDRLVGSVTLAAPGTPFAEIGRPDEAEVRMLAVARDVRRRGIADRLMTVVEAHARALGLGGVVLSTEPLMHPAHRLYERRGYVRAPERDWRVDGFTLLVYRLGLSPCGGQPHATATLSVAANRPSALLP